MSTPSKKRRVAREWMHRVSKRHEQECIDAMTMARDRANKEWREKLTRIIPPDEEGIVYPQGRIEQMYIYVTAPTELPEYAAIGDDPRKGPYRYDRLPPQIRFDAKQMAHVLPNGAKVVWWTWEIQR